MVSFKIWDLWIKQPNSFYRIDPDVLDWLDNHARNEYDVFLKGMLTSVDQQLPSNEVQNQFYDISIAMLFKLTWLGG